MSDDSPVAETPSLPAPSEAPASGHTAFQSFIDRTAMREKRSKSRRNTLVISLAVHGLALLSLLVYSLWQVDELWLPAVKVKVFERSTVPPGALTPQPFRPAPPRPVP